MWIDKENNEDPYNRNSTAPTQPTAIGSGAGGGAPVGAGEGNQTNTTPAGPNPVAAVPQTKSATVQDYLGANKEQGNQLGQQFQSKLNDVGAKDTKAIDDAATNVKSQVQAGTTAYDPTTVNKAYSDPTKVANDPGQLQSFLKQWNASYTGPQNFEGTEDFNKANAASTDAQTHATEVADAGGRKQILQDDFGVYGQGNKGLDHTLLQNADNFGDVINTGKSLGSIPDYLKSKSLDVNSAATKAASDTAATKKNTQDLFQNSLPDLQKSIGNQVQTNTTAATAKTNQIKADLASGNADKISTDLAKAGVSPNTIKEYLTNLNKTYSVNPDLTNYYTGNPATDINAANSATSADYAKAAALQKLTGQDYSGVLNPTNASKANTWDNSSTSFDTKNLSTYLQGQVAQQDKELMGRNNWAEIAQDANTINATDPKNYANTAGYQDLYNKVVNAAQRTNSLQRTTPGVPTHLEQLYTQAAQALVGTANGGQVNTNDPKIQGLLYFVREMGRTLYGKPQY